MPEALATRARALLRTSRYGRSLRWLDDTGSTNDDAAADGLAGAPSGHCVVADAQTRGRGSNGRSWASPAGEDLYLSIVDRPPLALAQLPPLTLAVGLGVAHAVDALLAVGAAHDPGRAPSLVKWPNDVRLGSRKCAGVLVEASSCGDAVGAVLIGIGLNVNRRSFPDELAGTATSLRNERPDAMPFDRAEVLAELLGHVEHEVDRFVRLGAASVVEALTPRLALLGRKVRCGASEGILLGVSASGALRLRTARGIEELYAGRLTECP